MRSHNGNRRTGTSIALLIQSRNATEINIPFRGCRRLSFPGGLPTSVHIDPRGTTENTSDIVSTGFSPYANTSVSCSEGKLNDVYIA